MKGFKKILLIVLCFITLIGLTGCGAKLKDADEFVAAFNADNFKNVEIIMKSTEKSSDEVEVYEMNVKMAGDNAYFYVKDVDSNGTETEECYFYTKDGVSYIAVKDGDSYNTSTTTSSAMDMTDLDLDDFASSEVYDQLTYNSKEKRYEYKDSEDSNEYIYFYFSSKKLSKIEYYYSFTISEESGSTTVVVEFKNYGKTKVKLPSAIA